MRVVILAAGMGSRLGFQDLPKPLSPLANGQTILSYQLKNLQEYFPLDRIVLVIGYHKEKLMETFPELMYVYNSQYTQENTAKSLLRALRKFDEDILWLNGDVVFHPSVLKQVLDEKRTSMIVNVGQVGEEEVKYRTDGNGRILEVSKQVTEAEGEALGINFISKNDLPLFCEKLTQCSSTDYFEKGIELCIQEQMYFHAIQVDANLCSEIDFPQDLEKANGLLAEWKNVND